MMLGYQRFEECLTQLGETSQGTGFVGTHQGRVASHVGGHYRGKPAFHNVSPLIRRLAVEEREIHAASTGLV